MAVQQVDLRILHVRAYYLPILGKGMRTLSISPADTKSQHLSDPAPFDNGFTDTATLVVRASANSTHLRIS